MTVSTERLILGGLVLSDDFVRQTVPFLQPEYFQDKAEQAVFETIKKYLHEYNTLPKKTALAIDVKNRDGLNDKETDYALEVVEDIYTLNVTDLDQKWLVKQAEEFCQSKAIYLAIMKAIAIYDGSEKVLTPHAIPDMIKDAVGITFNSHIGMDLFDDAESRYDYYTKPENKIPFDIDILNKITNGGCGKKTLNVIVAGVNVGKTLSLAHLAAAYMKSGLNVLYISMEMCEQEILKRIDANLLRVSINKIKDLGRDAFMNKIQKMKDKTRGKIKVKEFPPGAATAAHFKHLINELKMKQRFSPDVIIVDYIGITGSSRMKLGQQTSYFYLKAVAEELRALAVETETVLWTAMQITRQGIGSSDVEITDVSESMGIPATADLMLSVSRTEKLDKLGQLLFKQLKNRYGNKAHNLRFVIGVDLDKQTLYDVNQEEQADLVQVNPTSDQYKGVTSTRKIKDKFADFKV